MEEDNPQTLNDTPQEEPNEVAEEVTETPAETAEPTETTEVADEPVEEVVEEEVEERPQYPTFRPNIDISKLPQDENGLIDANALAQTFNEQLTQGIDAAVQQADARYQEQHIEERLWNKAVEKYPELKNDREMRDLVQNARLGELARTNKFPAPAQVADKLFKRMGDKKVEGAKQERESVKVQKSAVLETSTQKSDSTLNRRQQLEQRMTSPDTLTRESAQRELLKDMLFGAE